MILSESSARHIARSVVINARYAAQELIAQLGRHLTEDEDDEFTYMLQAKLQEALLEMEFLDPEKVPKIDRGQAWADDHRDVGFKRPKGKVIYTVTGEVAMFEHGLTRRHVPLVRRSSDGKEVPMLITELKEMVRVE